MVGTMIVAAYYGITTAAVAASAYMTAAAFAINFAVSQIVTRLFTDAPSSPQDNGVRQQVPPSAANAIPIVYGDAYMGGTFVDAVLSIDQKIMWYTLAVSSISPNGQFTFDQSDMYYGDRKITFDATDGARVVSLSDEASPPNVDTKIDGNLFIYLFKSDAAGNVTSLTNNPTMPWQIVTGANVPTGLDWPSTGRRMNGLAFAVVALVYSREDETTQLSPITFKVRHYLNGTGAAKPGDVWYDYMTNTVYGGAVPAAFVDSASVATLNTYSDQTITFTNSSGVSSTQSRYRINGVLDAGQTVLSNVDKIVSACDSWMTYNAALGQWSLVVNKSETAAYAFDDNNIIGEIRVSATDITSSINQIEAKFPFKENRDQPAFVNLATPPLLLYPNEPINKYSITYDLVNDSVQAQYLANRLLEQAREDLIVSFSTTYYGIQVDAGQVVSVTNSNYGWTNKLFRVTRVNEASLPDGSLGAKIEMSEYSAAVYDDQDITQYTPVPNSGLVSPNYFSALAAPVVVASRPSAAFASFDVKVTVPTTGRVTYGELFYTTLTSPGPFDWKVLATAGSPTGTPAANGADYTWTNMSLPAGTYYFAFIVGNEIGQSAQSPSSTAFTWTPVNSEAANVASLQSQVTLLSIDVADKVSKTTSNILTGTIVPQDAGGIKVGSITWSPTTGALTGGSGIAITEAGIIGAKSGVANFTIDTSGNALFKGDINTAGDAYFAGDNPATLTVPLGSTNYSVDYSAWGDGATNATSGTVLRVGHFGSSTATTSYANIGVYGFGPNTGKGYGVIGSGGWVGGAFFGTGNSSTALQAVPFSGATYALDVQGLMKISNSTMVTNLNADLLDGNHATAFATSGSTTPAYSANRLNGSTSNTLRFVSGTSTGIGTATFSGTTKPGGNSTNVWMTITIDSTTLYIPVWT